VKTQGKAINKKDILKYLIYLVIYDINVIVTNALHLCLDVLLLISRFGILEINIAKNEVKSKGNGKSKAILVQVYYRPTGFQEVEVPRFRNSRLMKFVSMSPVRICPL